MRRSIVLVGLLVGLAALSGCATFKMGEPMSSPPAMVSVDNLMDAPKANVGKPARVSGYVTAVCTGKAIFELGDEPGDKGEEDALLVVFGCCPPGCAIPAEAKGKKAIVEGKLVEFEMSVDDQKHIAKELGDSKETIDKITVPKKALKLDATYAQIEGVAGTCCGADKCKDGAKCGKDAKCSKDAKCTPDAKCTKDAKAACPATKCSGGEACKKAGKCVEDKK